MRGLGPPLSRYLSKFSILHEAANWGLPTLISHVCGPDRQKSETVDVNRTDEMDRTPLEAASLIGYLSAISELLNQGAETTVQVAITAANVTTNGAEVLVLLFDRGQDQILPLINEDTIQALAKIRYGNVILALLLDRERDHILPLITEDVLLAAARNPYYGKNIMALLLDHERDLILPLITDDILQVATETWYRGKKAVALLRLDLIENSGIGT